MDQTPIVIPSLLSLDRSSPEWIRSRFRSLPGLSLRQHWLEKTDETFRPATVHMASDPQFWVGYVLLKDDQIFNAAQKKGDRTWETGDVFEIFIQREDQKNYWEIHITPENFQLILQLPPAEERKNATIDDLLENYWKENINLESTVWKSPDLQQWEITWRIPWKTFGEGNPHDFQYQIAFCRYDYPTPNGTPILSSSAPLTKPNFHRISEWQQFSIQKI